MEWANKKGITLTETLVVISILVILTTVIFAIYLASNNIFNRERAYSELQQENSYVIDQIAKRIKVSYAVANYPEVTPTYSSDSDTLVLKAYSLDLNQNVNLSGTDYFIFYLNPSNTLNLQIISADSGRQSETLVLSRFVDEINFRYNNSTATQADAISIDLTQSKTIGRETKTVTTSLSASLRNK